MMENQENKIRMFYTVSAVCECNAELWQENEAFAGNYKKILSKISQIKNYKDLLLVETVSMETFKSVDRVELEEFGFYLSCKLKLFANETGNNTLLDEVRNHRKNLSSATDLELLTICSKLSNSCFTNLALLDNYGISSDSIADLQQLSSSFSSGVNRTKSSYSKTKSAKENLKKLVNDAEEILKDKLDSDIDFFKNSNPEFYNQYNVARILIDLEPSITLEANKIEGMVY